jgi:3-hydroxymyristoyl/3-hydroxydecanoyl-(acyl carrier protein) dehydratase
MPEQLGIFSFVDRVIDIDAGARARGSFAIPPELADFSPCLVAEAVGQLAAWVAMARDDFRRRPVAALAGEGHILGDATPGRILELGVEIEDWDDDAVAYAGWARIDDAPVIELKHCVGALLPLEDFDDPEVARQRFALLCGAGAQPGRFAGVADAEPVVLEREPGKRVRALLRVPEDAPFFADHFPRRPVFPATLLLDTHIRLALALARDVLACPAGVRLQPVRVADVKLRSFILPGQAVEITAERVAAAGDSVAVALAARVGEKRVATAGVNIAAQALP